MSISRLLTSLIVSCAAVFSASAQDISRSADTDRQTTVDADARPVTCVITLEAGNSRVHNTYLTPLTYEGTALGINYERWRTMRRQRFTARQRIDLSLAQPDSKGGNSSMQAGRARYHYALMKHWHKGSSAPLSMTPGSSSCSFYVGPYAGLDLGYDNNIKMGGGNNPSTAYFASNLGVSAAAALRFRLRGEQPVVMLQAQSPLIGMAIRPEYGASYYEAFLLKTSGNNLHFTSLGSQQDLDLRLSLDLPLAVICRRWGSTLRLGFDYHIDTMDINHTITRYSTGSLSLGWVYHYLPIRRHQSNLFKSSAYVAY